MNCLESFENQFLSEPIHRNLRFDEAKKKRLHFKLQKYDFDCNKQTITKILKNNKASSIINIFFMIKLNFASVLKHLSCIFKQIKIFLARNKHRVCF